MQAHFRSVLRRGRLIGCVYLDGSVDTEARTFRMAARLMALRLRARLKRALSPFLLDIAVQA